MRRAFGLPQALLIILIIAGIGTVTLRYVSIGSKHYADSYTREQAELFLQSATEAALLRISGYDRKTNNTCIPLIGIDSSDGRFHADVDITRYYLYNGKDNDGSTWNCNRVVAIQTPESHGMVEMSIVVRSLDPGSHPDKKLGNPVRIEHRSLQHP